MYVTSTPSLLSSHPGLASQAHGWDPNEYSHESIQDVSWICESGHKWLASITARVSGSDCPICSSIHILREFISTDISSVFGFKSLVDIGLKLNSDEQGKYINRIFTARTCRALQIESLQNSTFSIKDFILLVGPHLGNYSPNKRTTFLETLLHFSIDQFDFEVIFQNLPSFKIVHGNLIVHAFNQHGIEFAAKMAKIASSRDIVVLHLFESSANMDANQREILFSTVPHYVRPTYRAESFTIEEIKSGLPYIEDDHYFSNKIIATLDDGKSFDALIKEIEQGQYLSYLSKDYLYKVILKLVKNHPENCLDTILSAQQLGISTHHLTWIQLANKCTLNGVEEQFPWSSFFDLMIGRDPIELQFWFATLRSAYPQTYWKLFEFTGVPGRAKSLALFRALIQHLCYTKDENESPQLTDLHPNMEDLTKLLWHNCLEFVIQEKHVFSFSMLMQFVSCFAQFGNTALVETIGDQLALRNGRIEPLSNHSEFHVEKCISHCKAREMDNAFDIYLSIEPTFDPSYSYMEFLLTDLAREVSALDVSISIFKRHLRNRNVFDNRILTSLLRSPGFFFQYRYQAISIFDDLIAFGQKFDDRSLHAFVQSARYSCDLEELVALVNHIASNSIDLPIDALAELMFGYLYDNQVDNAITLLTKIASIDGDAATAEKFGSLLATYEEPLIDAVIRQWDR